MMTSAISSSIKTKEIDHGAMQPVSVSQSRWDSGVSEDVGRGCIRQGHQGQQHWYSCKAAVCVQVYHNDIKTECILRLHIINVAKIYALENTLLRDLKKKRMLYVIIIMYFSIRYRIYIYYITLDIKILD